MILADQIAVLRAGAKSNSSRRRRRSMTGPATRFVGGLHGCGEYPGRGTGTRAECASDLIGWSYRLAAAPSVTGGEVLGRGAGRKSIGLRLPDAGEGWPGSIVFSSNLGGRLLYEVEVAGVGRIKVERPRAAGIEAYSIGTAVTLQLNSRPVARC